MATVVRDELMVCHDCACVVANGEGDDRSAEAYEAWCKSYPGEDLVLACPSDDESACEGHGWYMCFVCGERNIGWGHPAVTFAREATPCDCANQTQTPDESTGRTLWKCDGCGILRSTMELYAVAE